MRFVIGLITSLGLLMCVTVAGQPATWSIAYDALRQARYVEAIASYQEMLSQGYRSAELHYYLGWAWEQQGQTAQALYQYEQALLMRPSFAAAADRREALWTTLPGQALPAEREPLHIWQEQLSQWGPDGLWLFASLISLWLMAAAFYIAWRQKNLYAGLLGAGCLVLALTALWLAHTAADRMLHPRQAIVLQEAVPLHASPDGKSPTITSLPAGQYLTLEDTLSGWQKARLPDDQYGWVLPEQIASW